MTAAMVFAAGMGTRMLPLTRDRPKALVPVAGRALIDHALEQVAGAAPVVVNVHHHADLLEAHLAGRGVLVSREVVLLDTGGGLRWALPLLGPGPVLTTNADSAWTGPTLRETLTAAWDGAAMDALMLLVPPERAIGTGGRRFALDGSGRMRAAADGLVATGACLMRTDAVREDPREIFSLLDAWLAMLAAGRLHGVVHPGRWADVGAPGRIAPAEAMLAAAG